nr:glycosyltransferase [Stenotrophomonas maltophilia]
MGWWNSKVVVTAARLDGQKGIYQALDGIAVALRDDCSVRYLIVGDGPERVRLQSRVRELGLENFVHFAGAVSRDEMVDYLSAADVMLFTTVRVEGLPMNILEALACGLPCIVSRHVVQQERPSEAIEEVDPHDPASVARAIKVIQPRRDRTSLLPERYSLQYAALSYLDLFSGASRSKGEVQ